ncbi:MAG: tetratricopeptide repeat protein [Thermoanaerobaculum sp.]|nr:tetratricopeptide repeat protein [Thermoanaerobaculum sp.]
MGWWLLTAWWWLFATNPLWSQDATRLALARSRVGEGQKLLQRGQLLEAEQRFRQAMDLLPELPSAYLGLGRTLCLAKRFAEAIPILEEAQQRYVNWQQKAAAAELEARQEAADRARQFADLLRLQQGKTPATAAGGSSTGISPMANLARARMATEEYLARRRWQAETVAGIPAEVFYLLGLSRLRTGDRQGGIRDLYLCLALDPRNGAAHYNLAVALLAEGDPWAARDHLTEAQALQVTPHPQFVQDLERALAQAPPRPPE